MREFRYSPVQELRLIKSDDGKRTLTGYAAVYNSRSEDLGGFVETINPGAFTRALRDKQDVVALSEHDAKKGLLGRSSSGTLRLSEDSRGLRCEIDLPNTNLGNDIAESVSRGDIRGMSFGFVAKDQAWDNQGKTTVRTLKDVDLIDCSVVAFPAYNATSVQMRSLMFPDGVPEFRADAKEKTVDGEVLHADDFLIVGNPEDPETWKLPVHFSTEEKTQSHLRDALSRFDQLQDVPEAEKAEAHAKLVKLAKEHGIDVSAGDKRSEQKESDELLAAFLERKLRTV